MDNRKLKSGRLAACLLLAFLVVSMFAVISGVKATGLFSDGFESGDFSKWDGTIGGPTVSSAWAKSGIYSEYVNTGNVDSYCHKHFEGVTTVYVRCYVNVTAYTGTGQRGFISLHNGSVAVGTFIGSVGIDTANHNWWLGYFDQWGTLHNRVSASMMTLNTVNCVEFKAVMSATVGEFRLYVNGSEVTDVAVTGINNIKVAGEKVSVVLIGEPFTCNEAAATAYVDDVVVDTSYIGPESRTLTVGVSGHGVTNATGTSTHYQYSNVTVLATPDSGYLLSHWLLNSSDVGSANPYTVNMTDNWNLTAVFKDGVYLSLNVDPNQATYSRNQSVTFMVSVLNEAGSSLNSTLTLSVTGPGGYYYLDFDKINAKAGASEYSFDWIVPNVIGTYIVEVSLVPMQLTAYDAAWLGVK